jgi:uncharacterized SAM-binding protein YcdF (DUF218 family)
MSKIGEYLKIKQKNEYAQKLHNEGKSQKTFEYFFAFMQRKYIFNAFFGVISVGSGTLFLNHYFSGSSEFLQAITLLSISLALFVEFVKYFCLNNFLIVTKNELLAAGASNWFAIRIFLFFTLVSLSASAFLSIQGVTLYSEQSTEKIAQITQKQVQNVVSLDSVNKVFELAKNEQKTAFLERENELNAKIAKLKEENSIVGVWSVQGEQNSKIVGKIESKILENQNSLAEKISQLDKAKETHLAAANQKNELNRSSIVQKEVAAETTKSGYNWIITAFCEVFSLLIAIFITVLEYQSTQEIRAENGNLKENSDPIVVVDQGVSLETEVFKMQKELEFMRKREVFYIENRGGQDQPKSTIGFQNPTNQLHGTGCKNESEFINRFGGLISDLKENKADFRTLMENHKANTIQVEYAKAYIQRNMQ